VGSEAQHWAEKCRSDDGPMRGGPDVCCGAMGEWIPNWSDSSARLIRRTAHGVFLLRRADERRRRLDNVGVPKPSIYTSVRMLERVAKNDCGQKGDFLELSSIGFHSVPFWKNVRRNAKTNSHLHLRRAFPLEVAPNP
jgi:hypothetical protein